MGTILLEILNGTDNVLQTTSVSLLAEGPGDGSRGVDVTTLVELVAVDVAAAEAGMRGRDGSDRGRDAGPEEASG